ncbi:putative polyhydroxyalkanoate synthesis repressor PhaR [delta proteobacterium NaphS2]|nr:putative polyhydroxyalkanoate synthesis repressor PhaR [delta proteobacterium NaphS2]
MAEKILIKKYANRRLYDTEKSNYITLDQVAEMIRKGRQVEVVDAKTREDVTAFILTQIILEAARKKDALLPAPLLHLIIQYGGNILQDFFDNHLQQTLKNYLIYKKTADEQFSKWLEMGMDLSGMAQKSIDALTPFQSFLDQFGAAMKTPENKKEE